MRDILLQMDTYAEPIPKSAIDQAVMFAQTLEGRISALATHIDIHVPDNWLAERLLHVNRLAAVEEASSRESGRISLAHFEKAAKAAGVFGEGYMVRSPLHGVGPCVAKHARTRDLCLVPVSNQNDSQRSVAEEVLFGSGRPILAFDPDRAPLHKGSLDRIAVAWDGSRCSARAIADSLPILKKSAEVRVVTFVGEKASAAPGLAQQLVRHLKTHDVEAQVDEIDGSHRSIGASLEAYIEQARPHFMVMGGFGSSKLKEFVLGGATEHVLNRPLIPTLFSH